MPPIAEGSSTYFAYKVETTPDTEENGAGATKIRRVTADVGLDAPEVQSQEKRSDFMEADSTQGTRSSPLSIGGHLWGGDYEDLWAAGLRRDFTDPGASSAGASDDFTISSGVLTRGAGGGESFLTDGRYVGEVVHLALMTTTANLARNVRITAMDATTLTLVAADGGAAIADDAGPNTGATVTPPGEVTYAPETAHTKKTISVERWDTNTLTGKKSWGNVIGSITLDAQPDQPVGLDFGGVGINRRNVATTPSFTSPAAAGSGKRLSAAIGVIRVDGTAIATVTGINIALDNGAAGRPVIGARETPTIFYARALGVTGSFTALSTGNTFSELRDNETRFSIEFLLEAPGTAPKEFVSIFMPACKVTDLGEDDPDGPTVETVQFRSLKPETVVSGVIQSTFLIQDSQNS